jgi:hypothetical protein
MPLMKTFIFFCSTTTTTTAKCGEPHEVGNHRLCGQLLELVIVAVKYVQSSVCAQDNYRIGQASIVVAQLSSDERLLPAHCGGLLRNDYPCGNGEVHSLVIVDQLLTLS